MNMQPMMTGSDVAASGGLDARADVPVTVQAREHFEVECYDRDGNFRWRDEFDNLVVTEGLNELIEKTFRAGAYTAAWYVGLTDGTPDFDATDTLASHAGWVEVTDYSEGARQALTLAAAADGSASNAASKAVFTLDGTVTVGGCFVTNAAGGTTGVLFGGGAFTKGDRALVEGDSLSVSVTISITAA